jgi:hypothetical protein
MSAMPEKTLDTPSPGPDGTPASCFIEDRCQAMVWMMRGLCAVDFVLAAVYVVRPGILM